MRYEMLGVCCCLLVPLLSNGMEPSDKEIPEFLKVVDTTPTSERDQVLNLYRSQSRFCLVPESEYTRLKRITQVERDIGLLYEALSKLNQERKDSVCNYLLSMKKGEQAQKLQSYLNKNPWILDEAHNIIYSFLKSAQNNPGEFTNSSIDSIVSAASSRSTTRSLQPSYFPVIPASTGMTGPADTETVRQLQLAQIQQNQMTQQLSLNAIAVALQKQRESHDSKRSDSGIQDAIQSAVDDAIKPKKLIKTGISIGLFLIVFTANSVISYFLGDQQKQCE